MKRGNKTRLGFALLLCGFAIICHWPSRASLLEKRYFFSGDGWIFLVNAKTGSSFRGKYRDAKGIYDGEAFKKIHKVFGARYGEPLSRISLRLIEYLDFLEDRLHPGARITVISGWRSPVYNRKLRNQGKLAAKASLHQYGMAADIKMEGVPPERLWEFIKQIHFGGAGYYHGELVHVDVGPARFWDEKTSGVGTDLSANNKLIGVVTDFDRYYPGETVALRFIRMTAFPIGVQPRFSLERVVGENRLEKTATFVPSFAVNISGDCPEFNDIGEMLGIRFKLPQSLPPGRYKIHVSFCGKLWDQMPAKILSPPFEIVPR